MSAIIILFQIFCKLCDEQIPFAPPNLQTIFKRHFKRCLLESDKLPIYLITRQLFGERLKKLKSKKMSDYDSHLQRFHKKSFPFCIKQLK